MPSEKCSDGIYFSESTPLQYGSVDVALVDSAITTAEETARVLAQEGLLNTDNNNPDYRFYVSDIPLKFRMIGERFLGRTMEQIEMVSLG